MNGAQFSQAARAAGGRKALRRQLSQRSWSPRPVALADPKPYWNALDGACAILLSFEIQGGPPSQQQTLFAMLDLQAWREHSLFGTAQGRESRWTRVLVAATDAQCRLTHGVEVALATCSMRPWATSQTLERRLLRALSADADALARRVAPHGAFWLVDAAMSRPKRFFNPQMALPDPQRELPLALCRFQAPRGSRSPKESFEGLREALTDLFGPRVHFHLGPMALPPSTPSEFWRRRREAFDLAQELPPPETRARRPGL